MKLFATTGILLIMGTTVTAVRRYDVVCVMGADPAKQHLIGMLGIAKRQIHGSNKWEVQIISSVLRQCETIPTVHLADVGLPHIQNVLRDVKYQVGTLENLRGELAERQVELDALKVELTALHPDLNRLKNTDIPAIRAQAEKGIVTKGQEVKQMLDSLKTVTLDIAKEANKSAEAAEKSKKDAEKTLAKAVGDRETAEKKAKIDIQTAEDKATRRLDTVVNNAKRAMDAAVLDAKAEGVAAVNGIANTVQTRVGALGEECIKRIRAGLKDDNLLTNSMKMKTDVEFLQTIVYVLSAVLAFLVLILVVAVAYTCIETQSPRRGHHQRRGMKPRRKNGDRRPRPEQRPRPKYRPRAHPQPRDGNRS